MIAFGSANYTVNITQNKEFSSIKHQNGYQNGYQIKKYQITKQLILNKKYNLGIIPPPSTELQ